MTTPRGAGSRPAGPVIVAGFDDQPGSATVLQTAADLADRLRAALVVVHALAPVAPLPVTPAAAGNALVLPAALPPPLDEQETAELSQAARARAASHLERTAVWHWVCEQGDPALLLQQQAKALDAYLVVVGAGEQGFGAAVQHLLAGSTGRRLRHGADRPLLLVPLIEEDEDSA